MCIAILNTKGFIKDEYLKNSWENNNQGGGLLWCENGKLFDFKTYKYKEFLNYYKKIRSRSSVQKIVLHFRIATSGHEKYINLHPFFITNNLGFVHNGIISGLGNDKHSDTYQFNEMLKMFKHDFLNCNITRELIREYISGSKLVFLDNQNKHTIINEDKGHWNGSDWYSNDSYKQSFDFVYFGNKKVSKQKSLFSWDDDFDFDYGYSDSYYNNYNTDKIKEDNLDYLYTYFLNTDSSTLSKFLSYTKKNLTDYDFYTFMEECSAVYQTNDLRKILFEMEEEEELENYV